jgi:glycosyltransferase involved in cell wall biosynthesis
MFAPFLQRFLRSCDRIIASSQEYVDSSLLLSAHRARCAIVPLGTDLGRPAAVCSTEARALQARFGPRIVLSVGRLVYYKGFDYLIRAMARVDGRLLIVGDGPLRGELEQIAAAAGVQEKVVFLGTVDDVVPFYQACDVFVLPSVSRNEAYGIVQLEAMACGKPVVNTNLASGVRFVSPHRVTGLTVPPRDESALAVAVNTLLEDEVLRATLGAAARWRVENEFTNARMVERTLDVYAQVLQERRANDNARVESRHHVEGFTNA